MRLGFIELLSDKGCQPHTRSLRIVSGCSDECLRRNWVRAKSGFAIRIGQAILVCTPKLEDEAIQIQISTDCDNEIQSKCTHRSL